MCQVERADFVVGAVERVDLRAFRHVECRQRVMAAVECLQFGIPAQVERSELRVSVCGQPFEFRVVRHVELVEAEAGIVAARAVQFLQFGITAQIDMLDRSQVSPARMAAHAEIEFLETRVVRHVELADIQVVDAERFKLRIVRYVDFRDAVVVGRGAVVHAAQQVDQFRVLRYVERREAVALAVEYLQIA